MDPLSMIVAVLVLGVGFTAGWVLRALTGDRTEPTQPRCGCGHSLGFHGEGGCAAHDEEHIPCTCRTYDGPRPFPGYYAPELTDPENP